MIITVLFYSNLADKKLQNVYKLIEKINIRDILYQCILSFGLKSILDLFRKLTIIHFKRVLLLTQLFFIFHVFHWIFVTNVII